MSPGQLIDREIVYKVGGLNYKGIVVMENPDEEGTLMVTVEDDEEEETIELSVTEVLDCLVGPPPDPEVRQEAPPTPAEEAEGCALWFKKGRKAALKKKPAFAAASDAELWAETQREWSVLSLERRMLWVRKVRDDANGRGTAAAPPRVVIKVGELVPAALWGRHKGMETLLMERSLLQPGSSLRGACESKSAHAANNRCCCKRLLASQSDFKSETSGLDRVVTSGGHRCLFLPKYHCELNWIERYWGASKKYARRHCGYSLTALRVTVPIALSQTCDELPEELRNELDLPVSPLLKMRRWARISRMYRAQYRLGANGHEAVRVVKAQKRHRDTSDTRSRQQEAAMEALAFA